MENPKPRILRTVIAQYQPAKFGGKNESGFEPVDDKVMVLTDEAVAITGGGIHLTPEAVERHAMAAETGTVAAVGAGAFYYSPDGSPWTGPKPSVGDRVYIERYSGQLVKGRDGNLYRLMSAKCVGAVESK